MSLAERWPLADHHALRDELLTAWDRPGYHDLRHLEEVLDRLAALTAAGVGFDPTMVGLAAWFHDAVYDGSADDEERSAQWAGRALPAAYADEVARLVGEAVTAAGNALPVGITVAVPGLVRSVDGVVPDAPNLGWHDVAVLDAPADEHGMSIRDPQRGVVFIAVARSRRPMRARRMRCRSASA